MWLLMVEALVALFLLVFIVWWTMYSGREPDEQGEQADRDEPPEPRADQPPEADKHQTPR